MAWLGSERHKEVFCREFLDTHQPYQVASLRWPELDPASRERLRSRPFWDEAVATERLTAAKVQAQTALETDPLIRRAVALQGAEEKRHSQLLDSLLRTYDIQPAGTGALARPVTVGADIERAFMRAEYGECFDSWGCVCGKTSGASACTTGACCAHASSPLWPGPCVGFCASRSADALVARRPVLGKHNLPQLNAAGIKSGGKGQQIILPHTPKALVIALPQDVPVGPKIITPGA